MYLYSPSSFVLRPRALLCHFYFSSHSLSKIKITHKQVNNYTHAHIAKISAIFLPLHHQKHEPMSKPISTIFGDILRRTQLDPTDPRYAPLLAIEGDVSDDAHRAITDSLSEMMTAEEAKNNADVQRHFRQRVLNPVDTEIERWIAELDAPDDVKAEIISDKNSYSRLRRTLEKTRELEAQKLTAASAAEKRDIQQRLDDLSGKLIATQQNAETRIAQVQSESHQRLTDYALRSALSSRKYANTRLTPQQNSDDARALLDAHLRSKGAALAIDNDKNSLRLMSASTPDAPYQENGKNIDFNDFLDSFLASKGVLQINDPAPPPPSGTTFHTHIPAHGRIPASNARAIAEMEQG